MTAEDNGVPEDDDPFAYLYRGQEGEDARSATPQPGVPRTSYQQATQVGRVQYGQPRQQPGGQPQAPQYQPPQYPQAQYPQTQQYQQQTPPPGQQTTQLPAPGGGKLPPPGGGRSRGRSGGSSRGVTYGAIGVALAVVVGIGVALLSSGGDPKPSVASTAASQAASAAPSGSGSTSASASPSTALPGATNVSAMTLGGGAVATNNHTGSASTDGKFVPLTASGMSVTWANVTVPTAGSYTFWVHYANAGPGSEDDFTLTVNGKPLPNSINLKNWSGITDWNKAWQRSYSQVTLNAGSNTIEVSYGSGSNAGVNVDQFAVTVSENTPPWP
jgi:hypothetical protein